MVRVMAEPLLAFGVAEVLTTRQAGNPEVLDAEVQTPTSVGVPQAGELLEPPKTPIVVTLADLVVSEPMTPVRAARVATHLSVDNPMTRLAVRPATDRNPSV